jgi:flagellar hook-associated protein 3 FlgL
MLNVTRPSAPPRTAVLTSAVQLQSAQDSLLQADTARVASQLSWAETQQAALTQVIAAIDHQGTLFTAL